MTAPNEADRKQARAAHPDTHAWVDASAGSGKTKVLTDRVLRLLLTGAAPHRILCLTFTKAAAANMSNRLMDRLAKWATLPNEQIQKDLHQLTRLVPETETIDKARSLFAALLDAPGGLQFQTIHSFCQSLLARFPLEAGVPLGFGVCDDRTSRALLDSAGREIFAAAAADPHGTLEQALEHLLSEFSEDRFRKLTGEIIGARSQLAPLLATGLSAKLREQLELAPDTTEEDLIKNFCSRDDSALRAALPILLTNADKKTEQKAVAALTAWLEQTPLQREHSLAAYLGWLLVESGSKIRAVIVTTAITSKHPAITDLLRKEQEAALRLSLSLRNFRCLKLTEAMLLYASELLTRYQRLKRERLTLDYEDLIEEAVQLVHRQDALWVLYKLDGGIDHVLVDEAQDTNERQWLLLRRLTGDFFAGQGAAENEGRTLFAVGDYKQSIYSFQGADPDAFINERAHYLEKAKAVKQAFAQEVFQVSFRSAQPVLDVVNSIFTGNPQTKDSLLDFPPHEAAPLNQHLAGRVEIWPLAPASVADEDPWLIPDRVRPYLAPRSRLAQIIARQIHSWCFVERREIPSRGRVMQPGDVLVLVRTRGSFVSELVKACKQLGLPVAGVDRMKLTEQLAVEDMLALLDVLLLPEDDLALATVLKGPLCALTEEALCTLAHSRDAESLWHRLQSRAKTDPQLATLTDYLRGLMSEADSVTPYALLASVLARPCPANSASGRKAMLTRLGAEASDPLDELLASCLDFEQNETPSLQSFLRWIRKDATEIKRELHQPMGQVRIMTVHGAKGLEAPVVILAEGRELPKDKNLLLIDRRAVECLPLLAASTG
jgi:ATP-dependent helicase/nuclease subunit A